MSAPRSDDVGQPLDSAVADALRLARKRARLSQEALAVMSGLNPKYIGVLERAERSPSVRTLGRVCAALGLTCAELMRLAEGLLPPF